MFRKSILLFYSLLLKLSILLLTIKLTSIILDKLVKLILIYFKIILYNNSNIFF